MTTVINWKTTPHLPIDQRAWPAHYINVQRPSRWGNKWSSKPSSIPGTIRVTSPRHAVARYTCALLRQVEGVPTIEEIRRELRSKTLVCGCVPAPCHGPVLAVIADSKEGDDLRALLAPFLFGLPCD